MRRLLAPYMPQQNAIREGDFRTIIEIARIFKYSNENLIFPEGMWQRSNVTIHRK